MTRRRTFFDPGVRRVLHHYRRIAEVRPWHIALPLALALLAGVAEGASYAVLVPLSDGVAAGDLTVVSGSAWLAWVPETVLETALASPRSGALIALLLLGLLFGLRFAKLALEYVRAHFLAHRDERYGRLVREETFGRVLTFGRQYFDGQALGHVDSEISWSTSAVRLLGATENLVIDGFRLAVKGVVVVVISPPLFGALVVSLLMIHGLLGSLSTAVGALAERATEAQKRVRREVLDLLGAIPLVKAHTQEAEARSTFRSTLRATEDLQVRRARLGHLSAPIEEILILFGAFLAEGMILYWSPGSAAGHIARFCAFFLVAQQCLPDVSAIMSSRLKIAEQIPRLEALARLFDDQGKFIVPSGSRPFTGVRQGIEVRGLHFHFHPDAPVLNGVYATFAAGEVTAVVGPSGAGKTTLADLVARVYDCPPGSIFIDGSDIRDFTLPSLHRGLALVSQDVWLLNRSLRDNLTFGLASTPADDTLRVALDDVGLVDWFDAQPAGLDTELGDRGVRLSGGQRQRVVLARTLLRAPEILILDEATSALDSAVELKVIEAIERRLSGCTVIVIAHRLSTLRDADHILVLDGGRVAERGTWEELMRKGDTFRTLYEAQFGETSESNLVSGPPT